MKHAFLILAHNEWELLRVLLGCLDDSRNDIYLHIDAKVEELPELHCDKARLTVLQDRVDVRWGDISMVKAEYALFEAALAKGGYAYYHLLSGVDLPLKDQDFIHGFFERNAGKEFIGYTLTEITPEIVRKAMRWHLFPGSFRDAGPVKRMLRSTFLRVQELLGIKRNRKLELKKGSQWVSVTEDMAKLFVSSKKQILKSFSHTFCSDEMVMQTLCWNSPLGANIFDRSDDARGCMRAIGWKDGCLHDWSAEDLPLLKASPALFARKFNSKDMNFIHNIIS